MLWLRHKKITCNYALLSPAVLLPEYLMFTNLCVLFLKLLNGVPPYKISVLITGCPRRDNSDSKYHDEEKYLIQPKTMKKL